MLEFQQKFGLENASLSFCFGYIKGKFYLEKEDKEIFKELFKTLSAPAQKEVGELFIDDCFFSFKCYDLNEAQVGEGLHFFVKKCGANINIHEKIRRTTEDAAVSPSGIFPKCKWVKSTADPVPDQR